MNCPCLIGEDEGDLHRNAVFGNLTASICDHFEVLDPGGPDVFQGFVCAGDALADGGVKALG